MRFTSARWLSMIGREACCLQARLHSPTDRTAPRDLGVQSIDDLAAQRAGPLM